MTLDIGKRLKDIRQERGLSQRELAKRTGVANASISQIESNRINPTVGALKRILDGIPVSLAEFFDEGAQGTEQIFFAAEELIEIGDGGISFRQVGASLKNNAIQFLHEKYRPGASTGKTALTHAGEECGMVLKGRLQVEVGEEKKILGPGDAYYFDSHKPHKFKNIGQEECELVSACTPPTF
ncbi:cupin domain-containing protein [Paremcibacter congregatus]|uniref:cupin domain-containing protein n=1 Tax=Paremcibacter congregatus TaxID=2043170 RepID=UPI0030ECBF7E|tara:strand:+ start:4872 stop:5420 length:549 start_codon:yes stop_codon:yes gene_type:complete